MIYNADQNLQICCVATNLRVGVVRVNSSLSSIVPPLFNPLHEQRIGTPILVESSFSFQPCATHRHLYVPIFTSAQINSKSIQEREGGSKVSRQARAQNMSLKRMRTN